MGWTKYTVFRILDVVFLSAVFIVQSVILSQYTVYSRNSSELPTGEYVNPIYQKLLWLLGDFICLMMFLLACLCGFRQLRRRRIEQNIHRQSPAVTEGPHVTNDKRWNTFSIYGFITSPHMPLCYISWLMYAALLVLKITLIFTSCLNQKWKTKKEHHEQILFGPQILQLGIGISAVVFSLLVEAHHNASKNDPKRNAYLKSVSYEVALEILDTACMLSFLLDTFDEEESRGEFCPSTILTPPIIVLSAVNLFLPTCTLYKLTWTNFGETYHVKLEMIYKTLHLILVNAPFLAIRIHLWNSNDREDVILILKNVYGIVGYFRGVYSDFKILTEERMEKEMRNSNRDEANGKVRKVNNRRREYDGQGTGSKSIEMEKLT